MNKPVLIRRREVLRSLVGGSLLMPGIVSQLLADSGDSSDPLAPKLPHHPAKAKRVIFIFSNGGVSHMDTFDHKPKLFAADGKTTGVGGGLSNQQRVLLKPGWEFRPGGKCGTLVSDLFPHLRECMDDICLIRSMKSDDNEHYQATLGIHTGSFFFSRPSIGSWVSYGLGTMNQQSAFVRRARSADALRRHADFQQRFPARLSSRRPRRSRQGTDRQPRSAARSSAPCRNSNSASRMRSTSSTSHARRNDSELAARMRTFETAFHMQTEAREVFDLSKETDETLELYGMKRGQTDGFGWQCLVGRRLAERGVRFIELVDGSSSHNWDQHGDMAEHAKHAQGIDQPIAGLLRDLKRRGMLDDTLVVWTTEFGRTPGVDGDKGPRPSQRLFLLLAGRRGRERRPHLRQHRRNRRHRRGKQSPRARFPRHHPASARHRSHAAHLPPRRPRLPPDRRSRRSRQRPPGLVLLAEVR